MRPSSRAGAAALLALAMGCSGDVVGVAVTIEVEEGCPVPETPWLPCGGSVGVWLLSGEEVIDSACVSFPAEPLSVLALPEILAPVRFDGLAEGDRLAIEIAVYSDEVGGSCPRYDPTNAPTRMPAYYGRSEVVEIASSPEPILVSLSCLDFILEPCVEDQWMAIRATVTGLDTLEPFPSGQLLGVSAGVLDVGGQYEERGELQPQGPEWVGEIDTDSNPESCLGVVATAEPGMRQFLSCETEVFGEEIAASAYATQDPEALLSLVPPDSQVVIGLGRVVNPDNHPLEGVQIIAEPNLQIWYPNDDLTRIDGDVTAGHGYFLVASDVPGCCYTVRAEPYGAVASPFGLTHELVTAILLRVLQ